MVKALSWKGFFRPVKLFCMTLVGGFDELVTSRGYHQYVREGRERGKERADQLDLEMARKKCPFMEDGSCSMECAHFKPAEVCLYRSHDPEDPEEWRVDDHNSEPPKCRLWPKQVSLWGGQ